MRHRIGSIAFAIGFLLPQAARATDTLGALLLGSNEVPGPGSPTGSAAALLLVDKTTVRFSILLRGDHFPVVTGLVLRHAVAGVVGDVVMDFGGGQFSRGSWARSTTRTTAELAAGLVAHPQEYYIEVNTQQFPAGAWRGQFEAPAPPLVLGAAFGLEPSLAANWVGDSLGAVLLGSNEVPGPGKAVGSGSALVVVDQRNLPVPARAIGARPGVGPFPLDDRKDLRFVNVSLLLEGCEGLRGIHIHKGQAGVAGPVVLVFPIGTRYGFRGGGVVKAEVAADLVANPQNYYIDVHSEEFPNGACRGQFRRLTADSVEAIAGDPGSGDGPLRTYSGFVPSSVGPRSKQAIRFPEPPHKFYGDSDFPLYATATSGLKVNFTASGDCSVSASTAHILSAGTCVVTAHQSGNGAFEAAADVDLGIPIEKSGQSILFPEPPPLTYLDPDLDLRAVSSSGLPLSYIAYGPCSVSRSSLHTLGAGTCTVTAHQPGNENFTAARIVEREVTIAKAEQTIAFTLLSNVNVAGSFYTVGAAASSGLPVDLTAKGACKIDGQKVHVVFVGSCRVTAQQPGDDNFNPAPDVTQDF